jgi:CheY-like chemotaxis protein
MQRTLTQTQPILIIEDSEEDYEATLRAFRNVHLSNPLIWCKSGDEALDLLRAQGTEVQDTETQPGLILLDLNIPGIDGRKTLEIIKNDDHLRHIPVVILTTSGSEQDVMACYQAGANTYVQKPVTFEGLIDAIRQMKEYWFEIALLPKQVQHPMH